MVIWVPLQRNTQCRVPQTNVCLGKFLTKYSSWKRDMLSSTRILWSCEGRSKNWLPLQSTLSHECMQPAFVYPINVNITKYLNQSIIAVYPQQSDLWQWQMSNENHPPFSLVCQVIRSLTFTNISEIQCISLKNYYDLLSHIRLYPFRLYYCNKRHAIPYQNRMHSQSQSPSRAIYI